MKRLQKLLAEEKRRAYLSAFDVYPSKLFEEAKQRLCILILSNRIAKTSWWTTGYNRWKPQERSSLFPNLDYQRSYLDKELCMIPKLGDKVAQQILRKIEEFKLPVYKSPPTSPSFYVHRIPYNYVKAFNFEPYFWNEVHGRKKSEDYKPYQAEPLEVNESLLAVLNSNLFFWWWYSLFEGYHCGRHEILSFPAGVTQMTVETKEILAAQVKRLMVDYQANSRRKSANYKKTGKVVYDEFFPRKSKAIIDQIDATLASHFGFTDEELDFIINYDIKYRMGL